MYKIHRYFLTLFSFMLVLTATIRNNPVYRKPQLNFVFDLGDVLVNASKPKAFFLELKPTKIFSFFLKNGTFPNHNTLFDILEKIGGKQVHEPFACHNEGRPLPKIMCKWQTGQMSNEQIRTLCLQEINNHPEWFKNTAHKKFIIEMIKITFTPERLINIMQMKPKYVKLIQKLKAEGHHIFILSNWDAESFAHLKEKYTDFFEQVDGIVISGEAGCMKPDRKIYEILLTKFNLNPKTCIFIDDREENIVAAQLCGIQTILMEKDTKLKYALNDQLQEHAAPVIV